MPEESKNKSLKTMWEEVLSTGKLPPEGDKDVGLAVYAVYCVALNEKKPWWHQADIARKYYKGDQLDRTKIPIGEPCIVDNQVKTAVETM